MAVPIVYRKAADTNIQSYDYSDAASGLGYRVYYGVNSSSYSILLKEATDSQVPKSQATFSSETYALISNKSWDLDFNTSQIIAGAPLYAAVTLDLSGALGNGNCDLRLDLVTYQVDSSNNATLLAQSSGARVLISVAASARLVAKVTMPRATIKRGEKLRVVTSVLGKQQSAGGGSTFDVWHDGTARGTSANDQVNPDSAVADLNYKNSTDLKVIVPFKLDI